MRITIVTTSFPLNPDDISGTFIKSLADNLNKLCNVAVLTPCSTHQLSENPDIKYSVNCFKYAPQRWQLIAHQPGGIPVALRKNKPLYFLLPILILKLFISCISQARKTDIFHANWSAVGLIVGIAAFLTRTPCVTTLRGSDIERLHESRLSRLSLHGCLFLNKKVFSVSHDIQDTIIKVFPKFRDKVFTVQNGVADLFFNMKKSSSATDSIQFITVGSLISRKNIDTLLNALADCHNSINYKCIIVGDGPERKKLEKLSTELKIEDSVEFTGTLMQTGIANLLSESDIFVLTSRFEGRPNVILEAMAVGLPIIASNIGGTPELVQDGINGYLCDPDDQNCFAEKFALLASNPDKRSSMGASSREFILKNELTWQATAKNYYRHYGELL